VADAAKVGFSLAAARNSKGSDTLNYSLQYQEAIRQQHE